jgi:subtilisin-like proprotein convertase family protein
MLLVHRKVRFGAAGLLAGLALGVLAPVAGAQLAVEHQSTTVTEVGGNGDGALDPGEGFSLTEQVLSSEFDVLGGLSGALSTASPGVTLGVATSPYPDLTFGTPAANTTPFTGSLAATAECGAPLDFTLGLTTDHGTVDVPVRVPVGHAGATVAYDAAGVPVSLVDFATASSATEVVGAGRVKDVNVRVGRISHTAVGDLRVEVVAPDGTAVTLLDRRGDVGDDVVSAVFDQQAAQSVLSARPPFTGTFRPEGDLGRLVGLAAEGTWRLRVTDEAGGDEGAIEAWGVDVTRAECAVPPPPPPPPPTGDGKCRKPGHDSPGHRRKCPATTAGSVATTAKGIAADPSG